MNLCHPNIDLHWSGVYFSTAVGVPGTGVGSRWLECLTSNPHASLFSGSMLPRLHIFIYIKGKYSGTKNTTNLTNEHSNMILYGQMYAWLKLSAFCGYSFKAKNS